MDSARSALARPRHIVVSLIVFLVLGGAGGLVVGLGAADGEAFDTRMAVPHIGDAGIYQLNKAPLDDDARYRGFQEGRHREFVFELQDTAVHYDVNGSARWTVVVQMNETSDRGPSNNTLFVDPVKGISVGSTGQSTHFYDRNEGLVESSESYTVWRSTSFDSTARLPCGLFDPLQGVTPKTTEWKRHQHDCEWGSGPSNPNASWRRIRGITPETEGLLAVEYLDTHPSDHPAFWNTQQPDWVAFYRPDIPYPVRMVDVIGGAFGAPGDALELTHFTRGVAPVPPQPATMADLPPLTMAKRTPWTISDAGVEHPWPLSEAYRYAFNDDESGLKQFIQAHPDAYMAQAAHAAFDTERRSERWSFTVTDGSARHFVTIAQDRGQAQLLPGIGLGDETISYHYEDPWTAPVDDRILPPPDLVPAEFPTAKSLLAQWGMAMAGTGNPDASPSWSFLITCQEECSEVDVAIQAGQVYYYRELQPGYPLIDNRFDAWDTSELYWYNQQLLSGQESFQVSETSVAPPLPTAQARPDRASEELARIPDNSVWAWPSPEEAAAVGAAALLAALLYYLSPAAKLGAVGLFSRIRQDQVLHHPERRAIHAAIEANPGIHQNALKRDLGLANGVLRHHLDKLANASVVVPVAAAGYTCYYPKGAIDRRVMAALPVLKAAGAKRILEAVLSQPGCSNAELAAAAKMAPQTAHYHVQRLKDAGIITTERRGKFLHLHPTQTAHAVAALAA